MSNKKIVSIDSVAIKETHGCILAGAPEPNYFYGRLEHILQSTWRGAYHLIKEPEGTKVLPWYEVVVHLTTVEGADPFIDEIEEDGMMMTLAFYASKEDINTMSIRQLVDKHLTADIWKQNAKGWEW